MANGAGTVMKLSAADVAPLLIQGFSHLQCRELCEATAGFKISRINAECEQVELLREWCFSRGLACEVSDFGVQENLRNEGKGAWWNTGRRVSDDASIRYVYVGLCRKQVSEMKLLEAGPTPNHRRIAELLAIPECCAAFYGKFRDEAVNGHDDDYATLTSRSTLATPPYAWQTNYFAQYFGFSLVHHYPCRWDCAATFDRARRAEAVVEGVSSDWLALHRRWLCAVVVLEGKTAVHLIRGSLQHMLVRFRPDQIRSTADTPFLDRLRRVGELEWTDRLAPRRERGASESVPEDLLILPFTRAEVLA